MRNASASSSSGSARCSTPDDVSNRHDRAPPSERRRQNSARAASSNGRGPGGNVSNHSSNESPGWWRSLSRAAASATASACDGKGSPAIVTRSRLSTDTSAAEDPVAAIGAAARVRFRICSRRARSNGGVPTVVASTTRISAPYTSCPNTPSRRPSVAKISPTSPRGIMPMPTSSRSPGLPNIPAAATSLPSDGDGEQRGRDAEHLPVAPSPRCRRRCRSGGRTPARAGARSAPARCGSDPADVVRASARPATNAPMIGARSARCASSENASVNANASTTSVPAERL